jgi:hypothetical protein
MTPRPDPGSFRDRSSRVFYAGDAVFRTLDAAALDSWRQLAQRPFFRRLLAAGKVVGSEEATAPPGLEAALPPPDGGSWAGVLRHERVPFVSYPFEWPFGMLRAAAELQLELLDEALADGFTLKDASSYNVQWLGTRPVFIDAASFVPWTPGDPWVGYQQFCQLFLYPLLLTAHKDIAFQPVLRGQLEGPGAQQCARLFGWRDLLRRGVLAHVWLQARLQRATEGSGRGLRGELRAARLPREVVVANVRRMRRLVAGLEWSSRRSQWSEYAAECSYTAADAATKRSFVATAAAQRRWRLVWDLGANTGTYTRIAAEHADYALALDADHLAVERLYRALAAEGERRILPLVYDVLDPSPGLGWRGRERRPLEGRGEPDLVLALALLHHLAIGTCRFPSSSTGSPAIARTWSSSS